MRKISRPSDLHARFVEAYFTHLENATRAYLQVKPHVSDTTANTEGSRLLANPKVQQLVEKRRAELRAKSALTAERVYEELSGIGYFNPKNLLNEKGEVKPLHELDDRTACALEVVVENGQMRYRAHDKNRALEQATKILRLTDRPPPPPPDADTGKPVDMRSVAKRLLFILKKEAAERAAQPKLPDPKAKVA